MSTTTTSASDAQPVVDANIVVLPSRKGHHAPARIKPPSPKAKPVAPAETTAAPRPATLWLANHDTMIFAALTAIVLVLLIARWSQLSHWGRAEIAIERLTPAEHHERLDVNRATWVEFSQLEGIGEALAGRIVSDRDANGPFQSVDDLQRVKGIGPKTIERLREYLQVGP